jgi:hypothetical protein
VLAVLQACSITPLVKNAEALVRTSRRVLGDGLTFGLMRHTFMKQFCAGRGGVVCCCSGLYPAGWSRLQFGLMRHIFITR